LAFIDEGGRGRESLQAFDWDGLARDFAESIGSLFDTLERLIDLREFLPVPGIFVDLRLALVEEVCFVP
jgi:hypothetical protein